MSSHEDQPRRFSEGSEPHPPVELPPEMADWLKNQDIACFMQESNLGTVFIIKVPGREIQSVRGTVPILLRHELYQHPAAPVIRTVIDIFDQPDSRFSLETFTNVDDVQQRTDFVALADQDELHLFFFDEDLRHRLTKRVGNATSEHITEIVSVAEQLRAAIPPERFDFDRAKADVLARITL